MSPTTTTTIEYIAFDGPLRLAWAIALGVLLAAFCGWALWRESGILGRRNTLLFWLLRSTALAAAIWMLLSPTNVQRETSTTRRAVAIVTDVSGSMQTVDPAGTSDDLRWAVSSAASGKYAATPAVDKAVAAIGTAGLRLQRATEALKQHEPESMAIRATTSANTAIERARSHLRSVADLPGDARASANSRMRARNLANLLQGPEFQALQELCTALEKGRTPSQKGWRESLPDLERRLAGLRRPLRELARQLAAEESTQVAGGNPNLLSSVRNLPRLGRAAAFLQHLEQSTLPGIRKKVDLRLLSFDQTAHHLPNPSALQQRLNALLKSGGPRSESESSTASRGNPPATDISAVLVKLQRERQEQPLAAVFLLSDMHHNQITESNPRDAATALVDTPVYSIPIGDTQPARDLILQAVSAPAIAMRNDEVVIEVGLQAHDCEGEICAVQLLQEGEVIDFREVLLDSQFASRTVLFHQRMHETGKQQFQVAITPLTGERTEENNYGEFDVNVTRSDIKVLLADELPRWEYRYLAQLFRRDAKVDCDELLFHPRMIATGRRAETETVPKTVDEWQWYDVVLMGDLPPEHLPIEAQQSLVEYVRRRGGTLVVIAGRESMPQAYAQGPLAEILPVLSLEGGEIADSPGYAFYVTAEGRGHHALMIGETAEETRTAWDFVNRFSPLHELSAWRRPRPSARTLIAAIPEGSADLEAAAKENAFLCWQPVGRGRTVYLAAPDTYRLRFLRGDRFHYRFWGQLLRWAIASDLSAGTELVRIRTDKSRYQTGETVQVTVRVNDADGEPVVADDLQVRVNSTDDQRTVPLVPVADVPGEYTAVVRSLPPGVFRIEPIKIPGSGSIQREEAPLFQKSRASEPKLPSASFTVQADLPMELADTRCDTALAEQIASVTGGQVIPPTALGEILELTDLEPIKSERMARRPLWVQWEYLWLIFGCLSIEWVVRKWKGLS